MNNKRIIAGFIDFIITAIIQFFLMVLIVIYPMISQQISNEYEIILRSIIVTLIAILYLIIRDLIGNESIGKKIFKLKIIDTKTKNTAKFHQRLLRNVTWILGPIEIIYFISKKFNKRIGDYIGKTDIIL